MASPDDLRALNLIAERSAEGRAVPSSTIDDAGFDAAIIQNLQAAGSVKLVDEKGGPAVTITAAGLATLNEQRSR